MGISVYGSADPGAVANEIKGLREQLAEEEEKYRNCRSGEEGQSCRREASERIQSLREKIGAKTNDLSRAEQLRDNERARDARRAAEKQSNKEKTFGVIAMAAGGAMIRAGFAPCPPSSCNYPLIAVGVATAGLGMNAYLNAKNNLDTTANELTDGTPTGPDAPPPNPLIPDIPNPFNIGQDKFDRILTRQEEPFPCPPGSPPNCKMKRDPETGELKLTHREDKDKDGFGDEEISSADAAKVNQNDPKLQAAIQAAKAPYAGLLAGLEDDEGEGDDEGIMADDGETGVGGESFLAGGAVRSGGAGGTSGGGRKARRARAEDDVGKAVKGLMAQFMQKKKKKKGLTGKSKTMGNSQIGVARDNIFLMIHRRYQERRGESEFLEGLQKPVLTQG